MSLKTRRDYDRAVAVVMQVIHSWDPYGLLGMGAPADEFDSEIASVVTQIPRITSTAEATHAIARVFGSAFGEDEFGVDQCADVGANLYAALRDAGFINT